MRTANRSIVILVNKVIEQSLPLIMAIVLVRIIDKTTFGMFRQVSMIYLLLSSLFCLNIPASMYYFIPVSSPEKRRGVITQSVFILFLMACIVSSIMWFGAKFLAIHIAKTPELVEPIKAYSFFAFGGLVCLLVSPTLISQKRVILSGIYQISFSLLRILTIVIIFFCGWSLINVMHAAVVVSLIGAIVGLVIFWFTTSGSKFAISIKSVQEQLGYIIPLAAAGVTGIFARHLDKWIIMFFFSSSQYADYSIGAIQIPIISLITGSVTNAILPDIVQMGKNGRKEDAIKLWHMGIRKSALVIFPAYILCLIISRDLIILFFSKEYIGSIGPFVVYLSLLPIQIAIYGTILKAFGFTKPILWAAVFGLILNLILSVIGVVIFKGSYFAFMMPAVGTVVAVIITNGYQLKCVAKITGVSFLRVFPWKDCAKLFLLAAVCGLSVIPMQFIGIHYVYRIVSSAIVYGTVFVSMMILFNLLRDDEKKMLQDVFRLLKIKLLGK